jgi:ketosteroid isomerase-like protein
MQRLVVKILATLIKNKIGRFLIMIGAVLARRMVRPAFDALNRRDVAEFMAGYAEDATFSFPGNVPIGGETRGKKQIEAVLVRILERFPKMKFTVKEVFVSNIFALGGSNNIAVEWDLAQENREGKEFLNSGMTVVSAKGGKIVASRMYFYDTEKIKSAWGKE